MMVWVFLEDSKATGGGSARGLTRGDWTVNGDVLPDRRIEALARKRHQDADILGIHSVVDLSIEHRWLLLTEQLAGRGDLSLLLLLKPKKVRPGRRPTE